ncbi:DUF1990 domain-containing protein [Longispora sp. K20-0274]|uniref:DUF1990 domain-containing protein n=1 Tax=Longispora sp. K20-0274 TaxID=3088255 RepID=UPI00399AADCC
MTGYSYAEVGASTDWPLPEGYSHLVVRRPLGRIDLDAATGDLFGWRMHRAIPVGIATTGRAAPGVDVTVRLGVLRAPCRVVWTVEEPDRRGWAYGTLAGHPEHGEESFVLDRDADGVVWLTVTVFSRPAAWWARLAGPVVPLLQRVYAVRCAAALRALARRRGD